MSRAGLREARRVVVKVGSSSITDTTGRLDRERIADFASELCDLADGGIELVVVSSGAIAAGLAPLGLKRRPTDIATLQAAAAVGQSHLMDAYATAFEARGRACGQVLLTRSDVMHRQAYVNAVNTFNRLVALGAVPIVNENDTVATDEIRFGENDLLAALVANLVHADLLVLLSDVDGLHDGPDGPLISHVPRITTEVEAKAVGSRSAVGSGGMTSKLSAAKMATSSGIPAVIARAVPNAVASIMAGEQVGTYFDPTPTKMTRRRAWIAFATVSKGRVAVDSGAREALAGAKRSLLAAGVTGVEGDFAVGDAVEIMDASGEVFARGLVGFSSDELRRVVGLGSDAVAEILGDAAREVVHRDELVVL